MLAKIYYSLLFLCVISVLFFVAYLVSDSTKAWFAFYKIYIVFALAHTWYVFLLLFIVDYKKEKYPPYENEKVAVVIPVYNEDPELVERTITSILESKADIDMFVVDDGSTNGIQGHLKNMSKKYGITVHFFENNRGKREALHYAIKYLVTDQDFVVTVDSDTVFEEGALINLVKPLKVKNIGATTGEVRVLDENTNALTRMTASYYWSGLNMQRKAQSALGMVACCSGALAAYKTDLIKSFIDEFVEEEFLGKKCTYSDDRHLTNLVLKEGYDVKYISQSIAYTATPKAYKKFISQQLRWRRGFYQEAIVALTFMWKRKPILFLEILLWELIMPVLSIGIVFLVTVNSFFDPIFFLFGILPALALLLFIRHIPLFVYASDKIPGLFRFALFSYFFMFWLSLYALFTMRVKTWETR